MSTNFKRSRNLDCIGLYCPEPVYRTRMELDQMEVEEVLEVIADDPAAEEDIKSLVKHTGDEILELKRDGSVIKFLIKKAK